MVVESLIKVRACTWGTERLGQVGSSLASIMDGTVADGAQVIVAAIAPS